MSNENLKITEEEIKNALLRSGYLLENRVLEVVLKSGYWAEASHRYFVEEGKYREIDVMATRPLDSSTIKPKDEILTLYPHFLIECINNPVPLALFENVGDTEEPASDWSYKFTNGSSDLLELASLNMPYSIVKYESEIFGKKPSRQYCGFTEKKNLKPNDIERWMANHPEDFHQTLLKLVDISKRKKKEITKRWKEVRPTMSRLDMLIPLIVLQNDMMEIKTQPEIVINPIQYYRLKVPYKRDFNKSISIDIVTENGLISYLENKEKGLKAIFNDLVENLKEGNILGL